jgi:hypothetical protein
MPAPTYTSHVRSRARTRLTVEHLAAHGFTGRTDVETETVDGGHHTTVRRNGGSVPWTDHLHAWLKDTLSTMPGVERVTAANAQTVTIIWQSR